MQTPLPPVRPVDQRRSEIGNSGLGARSPRSPDRAIEASVALKCQSVRESETGRWENGPGMKGLRFWSWGFRSLSGTILLPTLIKKQQHGLAGLHAQGTQYLVRNFHSVVYLHNSEEHMLKQIDKIGPRDDHPNGIAKALSHHRRALINRARLSSVTKRPQEYVTLHWRPPEMAWFIAPPTRRSEFNCASIQLTSPSSPSPSSAASRATSPPYLASLPQNHPPSRTPGSRRT